MENDDYRAGEGGGVFVYAGVMALLYLLIIFIFALN